MTSSLPKILIVDDLPANLFALRRILSKLNVEVIEADNGNDALACTMEHDLALILLDAQMPGMDGYEVASLLRSNEDTRHIPIIFVTAAYKDDTHRALGYGAGAVDYVEKPIDDTILLSKTRIFIELYNHKRELERILALVEGANRQLLEEIAERRATEDALKRANIAAEAANRAKSAFLANMSHELRTPLNAVLGYAQILQQDSSLGENQRQNVSIIKRSGDYLLTIINDILDLAKVEAGHLEFFPHTFNLSHFFSEIRDMFYIRVLEKGLVFHYRATNELPIEINADEKRLRQICMNLLGNALKFTERGEVRLDADYQNSNLIISVTDSGVGIPDAMRQQIFKPFVQTGDNKYKQQGTGLGLAISRNLVERMGGHIDLTSEVGIGSCFKVYIPVSALNTNAVIPETHNSMVNGYKRTDGINNQFKILVVDDIAENRAVLRGLLQPLGFSIVEAVDGLEAVAITQQQNFDAIFIDLVMPNMDGLTATQQILNNSNDTDQVIIALTASAFEEDKTASITVGCKDYLVKPVELSTLLAILRKYLSLEWRSQATCFNSELELYDTPSPPTPLDDAHRKALLSMIQRGSIYEVIQYLEKLIKINACPNQARILLALAKSFKLNDIRRCLEKSTKTS